METAAAPNVGRPCLGLDVHTSSITATRLDPGGQTMKTWTFPTTRDALVGLTQEVMANVPIVLEASTAGKAVASLLKGEGRELHMAAPNKVALIARAQVKTDERDSATLAHLYQSGFLPECYVPPPEIDRLRLLVRARQEIRVKVGVVKNQLQSWGSTRRPMASVPMASLAISVPPKRTETLPPHGAPHRAPEFTT